MKSLLKKLVLGVFVLMNVGMTMVGASPDDPTAVYTEVKATVAKLKEELEGKGCLGYGPRNYSKFETYTFTTDVPPCIAGREIYLYKNCSMGSNDLLVIYACYNKGHFETTCLNDVLIRGTCRLGGGVMQRTRSILSTTYTLKDFIRSPLLCLNDLAINFIKENDPDWQPASKITVNEHFEIVEE